LFQISPTCDPTFGEALAALLATSLVASMKLKNFIIEGDSMVVMATLQAPSTVLNWHIERAIADFISIIPTSSSN
jgi:hypothetical protein